VVAAIPAFVSASGDARQTDQIQSQPFNFFTSAFFNTSPLLSVSTFSFPRFRF
jgi:hypothetical protein